MSEVKQIFTSGKMNKDLDERIIPNGEYRDALNLNSTTSEGENVGSLQNLLGNEMIHQVNNSLIGAKTIGSVRHEKEKKLYWFLTSNNLDGVYEYNQEQNKVNPVLIETKDTLFLNIDDIDISSDDNSNLIFTKFVQKDIEKVIDNDLDTSVTGAQTVVKTNVSLNNNRHNLNIDIPKGTIIEYTKDGGLLFYDTEYSGIDIVGITIICTYTYGSVLNFNEDKLITGINVIDGMLFWTDNFNQPRKINIKKFLKHTDDNFDKTTKINGQNFLERHISVAKLAPMSAPSLSLKEALVDGTESVSNITYNFKNPKKFASGSAQETDIQLLNLPADLTWQKNEVIKAVAKSSVVSTNNITEAPEVNFKVKSISTTNIGKDVTLTITSISGNDIDAEFVFLFDSQKGKALYELKFPMFSYRWKYKDNEYSVFSPFSETAFLPGEFFYNTETGYNMAMENNVKRIVLNEIEIGNEDVEEIDILYKDSRNSNIYTVDTVKRINELGTTFPGSYTITKEKIDAVVESNQILRQWDNVPRKALAQEITGNRIVYGNYLQNFNIPISTKLDLTVEKSESPIPNTSIKSNRNYQVGVIYIDEFNRQSPVQTGTADLDGGTILSISGEDPNTNKAIGAKVTSPAPAWATHFKYFIKESSMEYYNLALDNIYQEKNDTGFVWLSFSSNDINKIRPDKLVEDFIVLKKEHGGNTPVPFSQDSRFKVLDIQRDPPAFLSEKFNTKTQLNNIVFAQGAPPPMGQARTTRSYVTIQETALINSTPVKGGTQIAIRSANQSSISTDGVVEGAWKSTLTGEVLIKSGMFIEFSRENSTEVSNKYRIKNVVIESDDKDEIGIEIEGAFQEDVNFLYEDNNKNGGNYMMNGGSAATNGYTDVVMTVLEKDVEPLQNAKFAGRFFVKVENKNSIEKHLVEAGILGSKSASFLTHKNIRLDGRDRSPDHKKCSKSKSSKLSLAEKQDRSSWFIKQGGFKGGPTINFNGRDFHFNVIGATCIADKTGFPTLKTGQKIKFSNAGHDNIYEIDDVIQSNIEYSYSGGKGPVTLPQVYFKVKDIETQENILAEEVLTPDSDKTVYIQVVKMDATEFDFKNPNPAVFETEPRESPSELDIYYETQDAYSISEIGKKQTLRWYNCFNFNGVESNRIRDDYNAPTISKGVRVSATLAEKYKEERVFNGLIHSGIINSKNSVNKSNEFIQAEAITKNLLPSYGGVQKLHARDNDIVVLCENKIVKVLSDKDILYNADGSGNVRAARTPLGTTVAYNGEFGIGENPESFASFGYRAYFIDRPRGNVLRLSGDGIERISRYGMTNFWQNNLSKHSRFIGSYDEANNLYNITIPCLYTTCFDDAVNGWTSRKSWVSEFGVSLNNSFYTYRDGNLWLHESESVPRNNFYGEQYVSSLQCTMNESPSIIKRFKTIAYEGTNNWKARLITDQNKSSTMGFTDKENKYFSYIKGEVKNDITLNTKNISVQGLGNAENVTLGASTSIDANLLSVSIDIQPKKTPGINCDNSLFDTDGISTSTSVVKVDKNDLDKVYCVELFAKQGYDFSDTGFTSDIGNISPKGSNKQICFTGRELLQQQEDNKNLESAFKDKNTILVNDVEDSEGRGLPTPDTTSTGVTVYYTGTVNAITYNISGNYAFSGSNATINSSSGSYSVDSIKNTKAYIQERIITPASGYEINKDSITVNNNRVTLTKTVNADGTITVKEYVLIREYNESGIDYTVSATATTIPVSKKVLNSFSATPTTITGKGATVYINVKGDSGASGKLIITDSSGNQVTNGSIDFKID